MRGRGWSKAGAFGRSGGWAASPGLRSVPSLHSAGCPWRWNHWVCTDRRTESGLSQGQSNQSWGLPGAAPGGVGELASTGSLMEVGESRPRP